MQQCYFFRGYNSIQLTKYKQISHQLKNIYPHYSLHVKFLLYKFDDWKTRHFFVNVSKFRRQYPKTYLLYSQVFTKSNLCSINKSYRLYLDFFVNDNHDSNLTISYNLNSDISFAIREIMITALFCHPSCLSCSGPNISDCTSCIKNAALPNCACNPGFYFISCGQSTDNLCIDFCISCHSSCKTCSGGSANNCIICIEGFSLNADGTCTSTCASNFYFDNSECKPCVTPCITCISTTYCLACDSTNYLLLDTRVCVESCPSNYIEIISASALRECLPCESSCKTCAEYSAAYCLS